MKRLTILISFFICSISTSLLAEYVPQDKARKVASSFLNEVNPGLRSDMPEPALSYTAYLNTTGLRADGEPAVGYYVYSVPTGGFILVAGDDRAYPILGYSEQGIFDMENIPVNTSYWLEGYCSEIEHLIRTDSKATGTTQKKWNELSAGQHSKAAKTLNLNTALWGQGDPYNFYCPKQGDDLCVTGCVATAIGIVMNHYQWPKKGQGSHTYLAKELRRRITADFNVEYDWANMLYDYRDGWQEKQRDAVATLLYHCGVAVEMNYTSTTSWANVLVDNLKKYFDYHPAARYLVRDCYTDKDWITMLKNELDQDRPVLYRGMSKDESHLFVCDGYDSNNFFHMNWGWNGYWNGFFILSVLDPYEGNNGYYMAQGMTLDFVPSSFDAEVRDELRLGRLDGDGTGIVIESGKIERGVKFRLDAKWLANVGSNAFNGYIGLAIVNEKNVISDVFTSFKWDGGEIRPGYLGSCWFETTINEYWNDTDKLCLVYSNDRQNWKIMEGGTKTVNEIPLGKTKSKGYKINIPIITGASLSPLSGYDPEYVEEDKDFRFRITLDDAYKRWDILVLSNGNLIVSSGMYYAIENITEDQDIRIILTEPNATANTSLTANSLRAFVNEGIIYITAAPMNSHIVVYSASGKQVGSYIFTGNELQITPRERGVFFIRSGKEVVSLITNH